MFVIGALLEATLRRRDRRRLPARAPAAAVRLRVDGAGRGGPADAPVRRRAARGGVGGGGDDLAQARPAEARELPRARLRDDAAGELRQRHDRPERVGPRRRLPAGGTAGPATTTPCTSSSVVRVDDIPLKHDLPLPYGAFWGVGVSGYAMGTDFGLLIICVALLEEY